MKAPIAIVVGCAALAALVFAAPKSASATTAAAPAIQYGETHAGLVQEVGRRYYRRRYVRRITATGPTMVMATAIGPTAIIGPIMVTATAIGPTVILAMAIAIGVPASASDFPSSETK